MRLRIIKAGSEERGIYYKAQYRDFFQWHDITGAYQRPLAAFTVEKLEKRIAEVLEDKVVKEWTI